MKKKKFDDLNFLQQEWVKNHASKLAKAACDQKFQKQSYVDWINKAISQLHLYKGEELTDLSQGMVTFITSSYGIVYTEEKLITFNVISQLSMVQKTSLAVGDEVLFKLEGEEAYIKYVLPRKSILSRPDPTNTNVERVIASNMDTIFITCTITKPKLNTNLIDRFLIACYQTKAKIVLLVNKMDLNATKKESFLEKLETYADMGISYILCSASSKLNKEILEDEIANKTCVFLGASGVGKSSLINMLSEDLNLATNSLCDKSKGRHTTSASQVYFLKNGGKVIDTPGVREFKLLDISHETLQWYFKDFAKFYTCHFHNCTHTHENRCGIKEALADEKISKWRYESYLNIMDTLSTKKIFSKRFSKNYSKKNPHVNNDISS